MIASPRAPLPGPPPTLAELRGALQHWFGFQDFRPGQEAVITSVMGGQDTLALMPTGAGKSLCYQLPAMLLPGITLVISPLIALMKDQYDSLPKPVYERSTFINSSLDIGEVERRMADVLAGKIKLIYAAPERLRQQPFVHALARAGLALLVIDEAHCVSLWGHDFRPDYLFIGKVLPALGNPRLLGMTATATERVQQEIGTQLGRPLHIVQTSPFRPNLFYQVMHLKHQKEKTEALVRFCRDQKGSGIVYVRSRQQAEDLAFALRSRGVKAEHYHARLDPGERSAVQERWMLDRTRVIVATIAFGMGIDKQNVRFIVHYSPPDSVESYAQESGRAGRDGRPSICLMLATPGDRSNLTRWLREAAFNIDKLRTIYGATSRQVRGVGRPTLVNFGQMLQDTAVSTGQPLDETELRVGIGLMERVDLLVRHADAPANVGVQVQGALLAAPDPLFDRFLAACDLLPGRRAELRLSEIAAALEMSPLALEAALLRWRDEDRIGLRSGGREPVIERLPPPADVAGRLNALLADYDKAQLARIDQLFAYTGTDACRHQTLARHLGHTIDACGESCDNCRSGAARHARAPRSAAEQAADLDALLARAREDRVRLSRPPLSLKRALVIIDCVASQPYAVTKTALARVLGGRDNAPFTAAQVRGYGALTGQDRFDLPRQIDALVDLGYLAADTSGGSRLITLGSLEAVGTPPPAPTRRPPRDDADDGTWAAPAFRARPVAPPEDEPIEIIPASLPALPDNPAQIMLECIASLPFPMGRTGVAKVLAGADSSPVDADRCRHFGALSMCARTAIGQELLKLVEAGYLRQDLDGEFPLLALTTKGREEVPPPDLVRLGYKAGSGPDAARRRQEREEWRRGAYEAASRLAASVTANAIDSAEVEDRFERLRLWRRTTAQREGVPPFMIFHDRVLDALARTPVAGLDDLRAVRGIGSIALAKHGAALLEILAPAPSADEAEPQE
jgi:ATP-dependent DNA helicase RecQ